MKPLQEWICDTCGELIKRPEEGWVEWLEGIDDRVGDFRICHAVPFCPLAQDEITGPFCQQHVGRLGMHEMPLEDFADQGGLLEMLSFVDVDVGLDKEYQGYRARDLHEWAETCRRLLLPYYEEARIYWDDARNDGFFSGLTEISMYTPETLARLIGKYEPGGC
ncbi:MAG: hypothetical protein V1912_04295 [bacterium]